MPECLEAVPCRDEHKLPARFSRLERLRFPQLSTQQPFVERPDDGESSAAEEGREIRISIEPFRNEVDRELVVIARSTKGKNPCPTSMVL
jgi:hypothetical protein